MMKNSPDKPSSPAITDFEKIFIEIQSQLSSYLYRLLTNRSDVDDIVQDTFIRASESLSSFRGESTLKSWVFSIATNLAKDLLRKRKRWQVDAQDIGERIAMSRPDIIGEFHRLYADAEKGRYEIREHIDFCFTCIARTLTIEQQIALILKDVYDFPRKEIELIMNMGEGRIKHLLHDARTMMTEIFDRRCALVNKEGHCHQCSELAGFFNPKAQVQAELMRIEMVREADQTGRAELYSMRATLVAGIDPLDCNGSELHDAFLQCTRLAVGEIGPEEDPFRKQVH